MEKQESPSIVLLSWAAVAGNILFILWVSFNAINKGFQGTLPEKVSYVSLIGLLTTNVFLMLHFLATGKFVTF